MGLAGYPSTFSSKLLIFLGVFVGEHRPHSAVALPESAVTAAAHLLARLAALLLEVEPELERDVLLSRAALVLLLNLLDPLVQYLHLRSRKGQVTEFTL